MRVLVIVSVKSQEILSIKSQETLWRRNQKSMIKTKKRKRERRCRCLVYTSKSRKFANFVSTMSFILIFLLICFATKQMKVVSLKEIKRYQKTLDLLISFASFSRLMREMIQARSWSNDLRMQKTAIRATQKISKTMLINIFKSKWIWSINFRLLLIFLLVCNLTTIHVKRVIIQKKNLNFIQLLNRSDRKSVVHYAFECLLTFKNVWSTSSETYIDRLSKFS